mmetsp:Transcript_45836/g.77928  ORF Transcript_45836/g.77928 Transcript_45836/m.77928 type:complete len:92 (+) Transcript_45836:840-1115(+)
MLAQNDVATERTKYIWECDNPPAEVCGRRTVSPATGDEAGKLAVDKFSKMLFPARVVNARDLVSDCLQTRCRGLEKEFFKNAFMSNAFLEL